MAAARGQTGRPGRATRGWAITAARWSNALMPPPQQAGNPGQKNRTARHWGTASTRTPPGLLVIAKGRADPTRGWPKPFFDHTIQRRYVAMRCGQFSTEDEGTITGNIRPQSQGLGRSCSFFADGSDGKHAVTHWKVPETSLWLRNPRGVPSRNGAHPPDPASPHGVDRAPACSTTNATAATGIPHGASNFDLIPAVHRKLLRGDAAPRAARPPAGLRTPRKTHENVLFESPLPADFQSLLTKWNIYTSAAKETKEN